MKNIVSKLILGLLFVTIISCDENEDPAIYTGESLTYFTNGTSANFFVEDTDNATYQIPVGVTETSSSDRTFTVAIDEESTTATEDQYNLATTTFTIPAGEFFGYIEVEGYFENIPLESSTLTIDLISVEGSNVADFDSTFSLYLNQYCPFDIPLEYDATAYLSGSATNTFSVTLEPTGNLNEYEVTNMWGDFVAAATGDSSYEGQYAYPGTLNIGCTANVTFTGDESYGPGGSGTLNEATNTITVILSQELFTSDFTVEVILVPSI